MTKARRYLSYLTIFSILFSPYYEDASDLCSSTEFERPAIMTHQRNITLDEDGYFRHETGCPLVCIFDSQDGVKKPITESSWQKPVIGAPAVKTEAPESSSTRQAEHLHSRTAKCNLRPLKFINTSHPGQRKRLRTFKATKSNCRAQPMLTKHGESNNELEVSEPALARTPTSRNIKFQPNAKKEGPQAALILQQGRCFSRNVTAYPITMKPYMYMLVDFYFTISSFWYALPQSSCELQPMLEAWLPLAMSDPLLFHVLLCSSALHKTQLTGTESFEKIEHMKEAVHLLNIRLQDPAFQISDSTIVAVIHLADFENTVGNLALWKLHMEGLRKMVQMRGGLVVLNDTITSKLVRAEISGCINTLQKPRFEIPTATYLDWPSPKVEQLSGLCDGFKELSEAFAFDDHLVKTLYQAQVLPSMFNTTSPAILDELVTKAQWSLLLFQSNIYEDSQRNCIQDLCQIATLAFLEIIKPSYYPFSLNQYLTSSLLSETMQQKLKSCILNAEQVSEPPLRLILWSNFLGSNAGKWGECQKWFLSRLRRTARDLRLESWLEVELSLLRFPRVAGVQENLCRKAWDEAERDAL